MAKQLVFFLSVFIAGQVLAFFMAGETALATSALASSIDHDDTSLTVDSTSGFLSADYLLIDNELIQYAGISGSTFTGLTRGTRDTKGVSHPAGTRVYSESAGFMNQFVSFNVMESIADDGVFIGGFKALSGIAGSLTNAMIKVVAWDYEFLAGHAVWLKYLFLYPLSAGLVITFVGWIFRRGTA